MPTIPQKGNEFFGSFTIANNGMNLNLAYATKHQLVFDISLQEQYNLTKSNAYDVGIGQVFLKNKMLAMLSFGYGRHETHPVSMGLSQAVYRANVDVFRMGAYLNFALKQNLFLLVRCSSYWGDGSQNRIGDTYPYYAYTKNFRSVGFEPALFARFGKQKRMLFGFGVHWVKENKSNNGDKLFDPWPLWMGFGYQFRKKF